MTSHQEVEKSEKINIVSKINHFDLPARGRKVEKNQYIRKIAQVHLPTRGRKAKKSIYLFSKINYIDFSARGLKVEKSKNSNIFSKIDHFDLPPTRRSKSQKVKKNQYIQ